MEVTSSWTEANWRIMGKKAVKRLLVDLSEVRERKGKRKMRVRSSSEIMETSLMIFEHPMNKMKVVPLVDSEGVTSEASFKCEGFAIGEQGEGKKSKI
ncbi:hypothetical protein CDL15_Pgr012863 [Punica granatum]|uniref:Uncharacterized protein n=1 Tax=Punica granatum TaxID=22663 RepID=A0A218XGB8_PUNGR|nr:hypothetical protein CDL15_Pgr012863 [Punica granatum]